MCFALVWMALISLGSTTDGATNATWASWDDTWSQIASFRSVGTGLNTFGTAMIVYRPTILPKAGYNSYLQFAAEGGWLLLVPAAVVLILFVRQAVRRLLDRSGDEIDRGIRAAAVAGLVLVALYELVGLSLQVPGNVALFAVLGGIAISKP
jgi:O-antigen ligase